MPVRPADVFGVLPGVDADELHQEAKEGMGGVVTGTPPPVAPSPTGATGGLTGLRGAAATIGVIGVTEETSTQGDPVNPSEYGRGRDFVGKDSPLGFDPNIPDVPDPTDPTEGLSIPWYKIGVFIIILFTGRAFASESAEELFS